VAYGGGLWVGCGGGLVWAGWAGWAGVGCGWAVVVGWCGLDGLGGMAGVADQGLACPCTLFHLCLWSLLWLLSAFSIKSGCFPYIWLTQPA